MYRNPIFFSGLVPVLQCRELRMTGSQDKVKLYNSIIRRGIIICMLVFSLVCIIFIFLGFHSIALNGATDEDALVFILKFNISKQYF